MSAAVSALRGIALPAKRPPGWWRIRLVALLAIALTAVAGWTWLRTSSLVEVTDVSVNGAGGDRELVSTLEQTATGMSTLDVDAGMLAEAVEGFPAVASVGAEADFPHGLAIEVELRRPVAWAESSGEKIGIAADGTPLPGVAIPASAFELPGGEAFVSGDAASEEQAMLLVASAAPPELGALISSVDHAPSTGPVVVLEPGVEVRFGNRNQARAKWSAAAAVLADPTLTSLTYLDVSIPTRPAAGGAAIPEVEVQPEP